jgi:hypothetical protein
MQVAPETFDAWTSDLVHTAILMAMSSSSSQPSSPPSAKLRLPGKVVRREGRRGAGGCGRLVVVLSVVVLVAAVWVQHALILRGVTLGEMLGGGGGGVTLWGGGSVSAQTLLEATRAGGGDGVRAPSFSGPQGSAGGSGGGEGGGDRGEKVEGVSRLDIECSALRSQDGGGVPTLTSAGVRTEGYAHILERAYAYRGLEGCLHMAAAQGKAELVVQLVDVGGRSLLEKELGRGGTALHAAAAYGRCCSCMDVLQQYVCVAALCRRCSSVYVLQLYIGVAAVCMCCSSI